MLLLIGLTQVGKSTFINLLAGKKLAKVGTGEGSSVTSKVACYPNIVINKEKYDIYDSQGLMDTKL